MPRFSRVVAVFLIPGAVYTAAWWVARPAPTGDEVRYLAVAWSLARDGDFDLANQAADRSLASLFSHAAFLKTADYGSRAGEDAPLRSRHGVGLSVLLAPLLMAGLPLSALRVLLAWLAALTAWQLFELLRDWWPSTWELRLAWGAVVFSMPVVLYATQFYPDLVAALFIVVSLRLLTRKSPLALAGAAGAAALLPWFHLKLAPITAVLIAGALLRTRSCDPPERRAARLGIAALVVVVLAALATTYQALYGSFSPVAPYQEWTIAMTSRDYLEAAYRNVVGGLLSATYGWIPYAPIHWLGIAGLAPLLVHRPKWTLLGLAASGGYLATLCASQSIIHGWALPGRLLVVLVPFIAIPLYVSLRSSRVLRLCSIPLAALSAVIGYQAVFNIQALYPESTEVPGLALLAKLAPAWPLFHDIRQVNSSYATQGVDAMPGVVAPGTLVQSSRWPLTKGTYGAKVELEALSNPPSPMQVVAVLRAVGRGGGVLAERSVTAAELSTSTFRVFSLQFQLEEDRRAHVALEYTGAGGVAARNLILMRTTPAPDPFESWPLSACWILGAGVVGALLVRPAGGSCFALSTGR